jgi:hypothetical protein
LVFENRNPSSQTESMASTQTSYLSFPLYYNKNTGICVQQASCTHTAEFEDGKTLVVGTEIVTPEMD